MEVGTASTWPAGALALKAELEARPGRLALLGNQSHTEEAAKRLAEAWGTTPMFVGLALTASETAPSAEFVAKKLSDGAVFVDLEILFWDDLQIDPLPLLRQLARSGPRAFLWPGEIDGTSASFSHPGRPDHYEAQLSDTIVLRARAPRFPDEPPYDIERIP